ncbi:MAG: lysostaphin resistance A-like protein [Ardenticatenaceae bacterium]
MRQALSERRVSEKFPPSLTKLAYRKQIEIAKNNSNALYYLNILDDHDKDPTDRLGAAQWLCENEVAIPAAITALTELSFEENEPIAYKALIELTALDSPQAFDALRSILKWGASNEIRLKAGRFLKRKLLDQQNDQPLGLPPATPAALSLPATDCATLPNLAVRLPDSDSPPEIQPIQPPDAKVLNPVAEPASRAKGLPLRNGSAAAAAGTATPPKKKSILHTLPMMGALGDLQARTYNAARAIPFLSKVLDDSKLQTWLLPSFVLALITAGELLITFTNPVPAMGLYVVTLFVLLYNVLNTDEAVKRRLHIVLLLIPLTRILSLGLPLTELSQINSYAAVSIPLFVAMMLIIRQDSWSRQELGLTLKHLPLQIVTALAGLSLGWLQYQILQPEPLAPELSLQAVWLPALILFVSTGTLQELMFRGLLQNAAMPVLGHWSSLFFVSALFAILNISYLSLAGGLLMFGIGLIFGLVVAHSRSIIGVTLAHSIMNITLFLIWPYLLAL